MTLTRRGFLALGTGAAALAAAGPAGALETTFGKPDNNPTIDQDRYSSWDWMRFLLKGNEPFTAREAIVLEDGHAFRADFQGGRVMARDEDRIGILRDIPFVGQLFADRLRARDFESDTQIGQVYRLGDTLLIDLDPAGGSLQGRAAALQAASGQGLTLPGGQAVQSLVAANQKVSWHAPGGLFAPVDPSAPPTALQALASGVQPLPVGSAHRLQGRHLLVLVRPSILTGWS